MEMVRVLELDGTINADLDPNLTKEQIIDGFQQMILTRAVDDRGMNLQRQGRIGFYVPSDGEEASQIGCGMALKSTDWLYPSYRDPGLILSRDLDLKTFFCQLYGNDEDKTRGRQMPNHFALGGGQCVSISSPIATQIPQAVGTAMAAQIKGDDTVVLARFGDGGTSEGDFHVALNFAGVYKAPCVFVCTNNLWAISVPFERQTASKTVAQKAVAYGFDGVRVDGNDILAVYKVVSDAVEKARTGGGPTLIEAVTHRMGPHSSSDDPRRYRDQDSLDEEWNKKDPIARLRRYMEAKGMYEDGLQERLEEEAKNEVNEAYQAAEAVGPPPLVTIFEEVYSEMPKFLQEQRDELLRYKEAGV